jgi:hypothetical protein
MAKFNVFQKNKNQNSKAKLPKPADSHKFTSRCKQEQRKQFINGERSIFFVKQARKEHGVKLPSRIAALHKRHGG